MPDNVTNLKQVLAKLPSVDTLGLNRANEGPPLPKSSNIRWPKPVREFLQQNWPGAPFPRAWGERVVHHLPLGLGDVVLKVVDTFGL